MPTTPTAPQQPNLGSLLQPTLGAAFSFANPQASVLRRLIELLRVATSVGGYKYGSTGSPYLGGATGGLNIASGLLGASESPTTAGKVSGGVNAALGGVQVGAAAGVPAAKAALPVAGPALAAAGLGLSLADIAGNKNLTMGQKSGRATEAGFFAGTSLIPVAGQIMAAAKALEAVGGHLERSGSPQVRGTGRALSQVATPSGEKAFWDVVRGDRNMGAAFKARGGLEGLTLDMMGPVGAILKGVGVNLPFLHYTPTTGTQFRNQAGQIFNQLPELKGTNTSNYTIPQAALEALSPQARSAATTLADQLVGYAPASKSNTEAYRNQLVAMLLNQYGNQIPNVNLG